MFKKLKFIFEKNARIKRYETSDKLYAYKMEENNSVSEHILKTSGYYNHLAELGVVQSLPPSYKSFVLNYNMKG